jgi:hypothetical protein
MNETSLPLAAEETPLGWHCFTGDGHFGVCPVCRHENGEYINIGRDHWFYCRQHKKRWCAGANLFSGWRDETLNEQERIFDALGFGSFEIVKPFCPPTELPPTPTPDEVAAARREAVAIVSRHGTRDETKRLIEALWEQMSVDDVPF